MRRGMRAVTQCALLVLGLVVSTAAPAQTNGALASDLKGAIDPEGMPPDTTRYSVWHDDQGWHLRTTSISRQHFRGAIVVQGGAFADVRPFRPAGPGPQQDAFVESPDNRSINFDFATDGGIVGVDFNVNGDRSVIQFMLEIGEDEPKFDPDRIFIGHAGAHPRSNPFEFPGRLGQGGPPADYAARARLSWDALVRQLGSGVPKCPECFRNSLDSTEPTAVWSVSQIMAAGLDVGMLTGSQQEFDRGVSSLGRYLLQKRGTVGYTPGVDHTPPHDVRWWDDNSAVSISLLQAYEQLHDPQYLGMVQALWPFFSAGHSPQGGEMENEADPERGIQSTGWSDEVALLLYFDTAKNDRDRDAGTELLRSHYLAYARDNDAFVKQRLATKAHLYYTAWTDDPTKSPWYDPQTGQACRPRHDTPPPPPLPTPPPNVCTWIFDMNQGLMIGSDLLFYRLTGEKSYLQDATDTANATLDSYNLDWLYKQPAGVNVILFRNLLALDAVAPNPRYREAMRAYLDKAWNEARDPQTGFFTKGGIAQSGHKSGNALDQASMVQMFAIFAWPRDQLRLLH